MLWSVSWNRLHSHTKHLNCKPNIFVIYFISKIFRCLTFFLLKKIQYILYICTCIEIKKKGIYIVFFLIARQGGGISGSIYLYALVISEGYQVPVFSMLSERHDANFIYFWLTEWLRLGGSVPKEFTSDMSLALLIAAARAFANHSSLNSYIDTLFKCITSSNFNLVPNCFVRIDINHLMKNVASSPAFGRVRPKVKEFFVRCVAELVKITNIEMARLHIYDVLMVAHSQTEGLLMFTLNEYTL